MSTQAGEPKASRSWLPVILVARTTLNTSFRIVYPFLPSI